MQVQQASRRETFLFVLFQTVQSPGGRADNAAHGRPLAGALPTSGDGAACRSHAGAGGTPDHCLFESVSGLVVRGKP
jgi:hypothetical protein